MTKLGIVLVSVAALAACGGKKKGGAEGKPLDVAAVNALVPASMKDKVVFEKREVVEDRGNKTTYTVAAPKGWKQEMKDFATLKPDKDMGFMTSFKLGTNCDGECVAKDWPATIEKVYASYLKGKVIKDVKGDHRRTIIGESNGTVGVVVAWWEDGAKEYYSCGATLESEAKELAAAFEKACESVSVSED